MNAFQNMPAENSKKIQDSKCFPTSPTKRVCSHCGAELDDDNLFCIECGAKIEPLVQEMAQNRAQEIAANKETSNDEIPSDRMASIFETTKIKAGEIPSELKKLNPLAEAPLSNTRAISLSAPQKKSLSPGSYVYNGQNMTQYLFINEIRGNIVSAFVKTNFTNLSYSTEFYEGTIIEDKIRLHIVNSDLHPAAGFSIRLSEHFDGTVREKSISGNFTGEFSSSAIFIKC